MGLAERLEKHALIEFRGISDYLYKNIDCHSKVKDIDCHYKEQIQLNKSATCYLLSNEINEVESNEWKNVYRVNISGNTNNLIHSYLSSNEINSKNNQFKLGSSDSLSDLNNKTFNLDCVDTINNTL